MIAQIKNQVTDRILRALPIGLMQVRPHLLYWLGMVES